MRNVITGEVISRENFLEGVEERLMKETSAMWAGMLMALATTAKTPEERLELAAAVQANNVAAVMPKKQLLRFVADRKRNAAAVIKHAAA